MIELLVIVTGAFVIIGIVIEAVQAIERRDDEAEEAARRDAHLRSELDRQP